MKRVWLLVLTPLLLSAITAWAVKYVYCLIFNVDEARRLAISIDQTANAAFNGDEDETISSRAGRVKDNEKWACILCKLLHKIDPNHCENSIGR